MKKMMILMAGFMSVANMSAMLIKTVSKGMKLKPFYKMQQRLCATHIDSFYNRYALFKSIRENDTELERLLLARGAILEERDVDLLMRSGEDCCTLFEKNYPVSKKFESLHEMIQLKREAYPHNRSLKKLYKDGEEEYEQWQNSLLRFAIEGNDVEVMKLALQRGANVNEKTIFGKPVILEAKSLEAFQLMQDNGADIYVEVEKFLDYPGGNFLHIIMQCHIKDNRLLEYILTQNIDTRSLNNDGGNLWHSLVCGFVQAIGNDDFNILLNRAPLLHTWGIDPYFKDNDGKSAVDRVQDWIQNPCCGDCYKRELNFFEKLLVIMEKRDETTEKVNRE